MEGLNPLSISTFILGLIVYLIAGRMNYKKAEYEFNNRADGGAVGFKSFKHANRHNNKGCLIKFFGSVGMILMLLGFLMFVFS